MFYAIKWHYDQGKKDKQMDKRALLRAVAKVAAVFLLALLGVGLLAYFLVTKLGLAMT